MADDISSESLIFLAIFIVVAFWVVRLFIKLNSELKDKTDRVAAKMDELEREYVSLKPEIAELRAVMDARVDYPFLEKKLHELVAIVMERSRARRA